MGADAAEHIAKVGEGIVAAEFAGSDQAVEDSGAAGAGFAAGKEVVLAVMQSFA